MLVQVSPSVNIFEPLTYDYPGNEGDIQPGKRVIIPMGTRIISGWIVDTHSTYTGKVKNIIGVVQDDYTPGKNYLDFARAVSGVYFTSPGMVLDASLSPKRKSLNNIYFFPPGAAEADRETNSKPEKLVKYVKKIPELTRDGPIDFFYKNIPEQPGKVFPGDDAAGNEPPVAHYEERVLLGPSRLDRCREIIERCTKQGRTVLITVPDNLTAQYLKQNLPGVDIYNSSVKEKERENLWLDYLNGKSGVIVGGNAAVFLPIENLGAIICERAGAAGYKRNYFSKFDIEVLARTRAKSFQVPFIAASSGCTVESFRRKDAVSLEDKREGNPTAIDVVMLTAKDTGVPGKIVEIIKHYFLEKKKILVMLDRKESRSFLFCPKCKKIQKCPVCSGMLKISVQKQQHLTDVVSCARCHFEQLGFQRCSKCRENLTLIEEISISSLEKVIKREVVETGVVRISAEGLKEDAGVLQKIKAGEIVISTPVIVNPLYRDIFDAAIYIKPETLFNFDEYYAAETIFSRVSELREIVKEQGSIVIFSTFHFHYALRLINDEAAFFERELKYREWFLLPPFANVYNIQVKARDLRDLGKQTRAIYEKFKTALGIMKIYLASHHQQKGAYKAIIEVHALPEALRESGLLQKQNIAVEPVMI